MKILWQLLRWYVDVNITRGEIVHNTMVMMMMIVVMIMMTKMKVSLWWCIIKKLTLMMMLWWQRYVDVNLTRGEIVHNTVTPLPPASHLPPVRISPDLRFRRRFPHTSRFPQVSSWFPPDFSEYFSRTRELWFPRTSWFPSDVPAQLDFSERNAISRRLPLIKMTWKD